MHQRPTHTHGSLTRHRTRVLSLLMAGTLAGSGAAQENRWGPYADLKRAGELIESGQHEAAERLLGDLITQIPESAHAWYKLALAQSLQGKQQDAIKSLSEALALKEEWPQAHLLAAELLMTGAPEQATVHARRAAELAKGQHTIVRRAVRICLQLGDAEGCDELLAKVVAASPKDPETHFLVAEMALQAGDKEKAIVAYQKITDLEPRNPFAWESLARVHLASRQPKEALVAFRHALDIHPSDLETRKQVIALMMQLRVSPSELKAQRKYLRYYEWANQQAAKNNPDATEPSPVKLRRRRPPTSEPPK